MASEHDIEDRRLQTLARLSGRIRDHMDLFQPIADRAKIRFAVPIALVSVIDASQQIYLGNWGVPATSCPRDQSFCTYTIMSPSVMVVEDTLLDEKFKSHPFVVGPPKLRFYAGAPVTVEDDVRIGTVCLSDTRPRSFSKGDKMVLEHLAALVVQQLASLPEPPASDEAEIATLVGVADRTRRVGVRNWNARLN